MSRLPAIALWTCGAATVIALRSRDAGLVAARRSASHLRRNTTRAHAGDAREGPSSASSAPQLRRVVIYSEVTLANRCERAVRRRLRSSTIPSAAGGIGMFHVKHDEELAFCSAYAQAAEPRRHTSGRRPLPTTGELHPHQPSQCFGPPGQLPPTERTSLVMLRRLQRPALTPVAVHHTSKRWGAAIATTPPYSVGHTQRSGSASLRATLRRDGRNPIALVCILGYG